MLAILKSSFAWLEVSQLSRVIDKLKFFEKIGYQPHSEKQWGYHKSLSRFRIPSCGRRFGKSTMAAKDCEPELLVPKRRYWIVGPTYDLAEKEFREIWEDFIVKLQFGLNKKVKKAYNKRAGEMFIEFPWGTRIECRSAQHPEQLVGESLDGVIMSEAAKHNPETWERFIRPALSDKRGWATFPSTPEGHNWYYELWLMGQNPQIKEYESWRFPSWDNPVVYPGGFEDSEIRLLQETMSEERFMQEIGADFASFVGKIYPEFNVETHVSNVSFNPAWPNYITIDFGFVNPLAAIEFQVDPQDNIHIWREHYLSNKTLEEHIAMMKSGAYTSNGGMPTSQPDGYHINLAFGDAADPEAILYINQHWVPCIGDPAAKTNWRQGVDLVKRFLKMRDTGLLDENGAPITQEPKLFVDFSCVNTIREFINYKAMEGKNGNNAKEVGRKMDDHAMDALRYGLVHLFELGANSHLSEVYSSSTTYSGAAPDGGSSSGSIFTDAAVSNF